MLLLIGVALAADHEFDIGGDDDVRDNCVVANCIYAPGVIVTKVTYHVGASVRTGLAFNAFVRNSSSGTYYAASNTDQADITVNTGFDGYASSREVRWDLRNTDAEVCFVMWATADADHPLTTYTSRDEETLPFGGTLSYGSFSGTSSENCSGTSNWEIETDNTSLFNAMQLTIDAEDGDGDGSDEYDDCNDGIATIYPGADDPPGDGVDEDCDGIDPAGDTAGSGGNGGADDSGAGKPDSGGCGCAAPVAPSGLLGMALAALAVTRRGRRASQVTRADRSES